MGREQVIRILQNPLSWVWDENRRLLERELLSHTADVEIADLVWNYRPATEHARWEALKQRFTTKRFTNNVQELESPRQPASGDATAVTLDSGNYWRELLRKTGCRSQAEYNAESKRQNDWLAVPNPVVYIYKQRSVPLHYLQAAQRGVEELLVELGVVAKVLLMDAGEEFEQVVREVAARPMDGTFVTDEGTERSIATEQRAGALMHELHLLDIRHRYLPHSDIAIVDWSLPHWGEQARGIASMSVLWTHGNRDSDEHIRRLAKHEFCHQFGVDYPVRGGNCSTRGCLMTLAIEGNTMCLQCRAKAVAFLKAKEREYGKRLLPSR